MRAVIVRACLHARVYADESACGVFVSRSERPAPVINGVPVWGTARRRTQSLVETSAPPGLSFTWERREGGRVQGSGGRISIAVLYSLSFPLPIHASFIFFFLQELFSLTYTPTYFSPLVFFGPCPLLRTLCYLHMWFTQTPWAKHVFLNTRRKNREKKKREKKKSTGENEGVDDEEPQSPTLPASSSLRFGYVAPSSQC